MMETGLVSGEDTPINVVGGQKERGDNSVCRLPLDKVEVGRDERSTGPK